MAGGVAGAGSAGRQAPALRLRPVWCVLALLLIALAWGNSLVPGTQSAQMSNGVLDTLQAWLVGLGFDASWLTGYVVRKTAHVLEYCALGFCLVMAIRVNPASGRGILRHLLRLGAIAIILLLVPPIDECIQYLFSPGRAGQFSDVALDWNGAAAGVCIAWVGQWIFKPLRQRRRRRQGLMSAQDTPPEVPGPGAGLD